LRRQFEEIIDLLNLWNPETPYSFRNKFVTSAKKINFMEFAEETFSFYIHRFIRNFANKKLSYFFYRIRFLCKTCYPLYHTIIYDLDIENKTAKNCIIENVWWVCSTTREMGRCQWFMIAGVNEHYRMHAAWHEIFLWLFSAVRYWRWRESS